MAETVYTGPGLPGGYNIGSKTPIDVRQVVETTALRNAIKMTYPGMRVTVRGTKLVVGGVDTYPNLKTYELLVDRPPAASGNTTFDQDWREVGSGSGTANGAGYKGSYDAATNTPDLTDTTLRAALLPGDYYLVKSSVADFPTTIDTIDAAQANDGLYWNGTKFFLQQNSNVSAVEPLYDVTEGTKFAGDVKTLILSTVLTEYIPGQAYKAGSTVRDVYQGEGQNALVDVYYAVQDMSAATSSLPPVGHNNKGGYGWHLIATTNLQQLEGVPTNGDTIGKKASGSYAPLTTSAEKYLSPEETDARIAQAVGVGKAIRGGNARTFATSSITEAPAN